MSSNQNTNCFALEHGGDRSDMNPMEEECFVMGLEVLDNLPHDKIKWCDETEQWMETHVVRTQDDGLREEYRPLQDSLISETLKLFPPPSRKRLRVNLC